MVYKQAIQLQEIEIVLRVFVAWLRGIIRKLPENVRFVCDGTNISLGLKFADSFKNAKACKNSLGWADGGCGALDRRAVAIGAGGDSSALEFVRPEDIGKAIGTLKFQFPLKLHFPFFF